jgi:hypothetical protein
MVSENNLKNDDKQKIKPMIRPETTPMAIAAASPRVDVSSPATRNPLYYFILFGNREYEGQA